MNTDKTCSDCGGQIEFLGQNRRVFQPDPETMTDGQFAEQVAAGMGGPFEEGVHGETSRMYQCTECDQLLEEIR